MVWRVDVVLIVRKDFATSLSMLCRGSTEEKIRWLFILYDQDGDGNISRAELANMVVAVYGLMANHASPPIDDEALLNKVDQVFQVSYCCCTAPETFAHHLLTTAQS